MSKLPAFQFYPGDWRKDPGVQALSFHDRGVWFEIICIMHESECRGKLLLNGKAMPQEALARLLGLDNQILTTTLTNLSTYGVTSVCEETGAITSRRMIRDEEIRQVRKSCGKMGGNPNLVNQIPTTQVNQKSTPSSSSSSSDQEKIKSKREALTRFQPPTLDEVSSYCLERLNHVDPEKFLAYYESNGWKVGRNPMKSWKAAITTWEKGNQNGKQGFQSANEKANDNFRQQTGQLAANLGSGPFGDNKILSLTSQRPAGA